MIELGRLRLLVCLLGIAALAWATTGCGGAGAEGAGSDGAGVLSAKETKRLLRQLPYRYTFRSVATPKGAEAAVAGRAIGTHRTVFNFGVALGHGHYGVPVPRAGTIDSYGYPKGGFIFTGDSLIKGPDGRVIVNPRFKTAAQWREAGHMEVMMTDKLCLAATGKHCPP
jgi:hypothetical protein